MTDSHFVEEILQVDLGGDLNRVKVYQENDNHSYPCLLYPIRQSCYNSRIAEN